MIGAIAHYNLLERIGEGGLGEVYRARDTKVGRTVALKLVAARLRRPVTASSGCSRTPGRRPRCPIPTSPRCSTSATHEGGCYLAYEFVAGDRAAPAIERRGDEPPARARPRRADRRRAWPTRTRTACCTATCGPTPSSSPRRAAPRCSTSACRVWTRGGQLRALAAAAPDVVARRRRSTVAGLHVAGAGARRRGRSAHRRVLARRVIIYEMVTGQHPFAGPTRPRSCSTSPRRRRPCRAPSIRTCRR